MQGPYNQDLSGPPSLATRKPAQALAGAARRLRQHVHRLFSGNNEVRRGYSVLRNGLYNVSGQAVRVVIGLLTIPLLVGFLGLGEYGAWSLAYAVLWLMTLGNGGLGVAAAAFLPKDLAGGDRGEVCVTLTFVLGSAVLFGIVMGLLLWFAGPLIARSLVAFGGAERAEAGRALQIAGFGIPLLVLQGPLVGIEQAFDRYAIVNLFQTFQSVLANGGLAVVAWSGGRAVAMMRWEVLVCAALLGAHGWFVSRLLRGKRLGFQWNGNKAKRIFRFSLATWVSSLGSDIFSQWSRWIVGGALGAATLGVYSAITNMTGRINFFAGTAVQPLVPSLGRDRGTNTPTESRVRQAAHLNALIAIEVGVFLYVLADLVMRVMVPGATSPQDILGLQLSAVIYALYSFNAPGYFILFSAGEAWTNALVVLSSAVISLAFIFLGAWRLGLVGAIAGNAGYLTTFLLVSLGLRRVGVTMRRYLAWIRSPLLGLAAALLVGAVLENHFWWRVTFVVIQAGLLVAWFLHEEGGVARLKLGRAELAHGWGTGRK